ncbi:filamentous hemagglutinin N-terminal domain-containing protein [Sulfuricurvum sp.]|uniref:two-partner secretion domain-containing protein n=1 Tax=Sulfuricurvum sp. TaxID=2025608 RepID=UPI0025CD93A7|nr:filamentous hemagglutinin N-terminal domain-containing protein [Sulfuricurvum sp.]
MKYTPDFSSRFRILKGGKISLVVSALIAGSTMSFASPTSGQVTSGSASIIQNGSITTINQSSNKASINWNSFSIAPSETVNFVQPSSQSVTLNRVVGTTSSLIQGAMNANGQVFLLNPNGVLFANGSQVNVGGLVASTLNITDTNFQAGNYVFEGNSQNSIINMGTITTAQGGYVAMMGKHVANEGTIVATMGNVQMASGEKISLNLNGNSLVKLTIDKGTLNALVENKGLIKADGGQVYLTTQALNTILDGMVNNTGVIEAQTLNDLTGKVVLYAHGGTANVGGIIDASAPNRGNGGFIETSGKKVNVFNDARITTMATNGEIGMWLIDPATYTVAASGGDETGAALASRLLGTNITIQADNTITINDAVSWNAHKLILNSGGNILINADLTATGSGSLALYYGQSTANGGTNRYTVADGINVLIPNASAFTWKKGSSGTETNLVLDNGYLRFGNGTEASIDSMGSLLQPWYYDNVTNGRNGWYQLTFATYPLDFMIGVNGSGYNGGSLYDTASGNLNSAVSNLSINVAKYFEKTGTVTASMDVTTTAGTLPVTQSYTLDSGTNFVKAITSITNNTGASISNARLWIGTQDDFVAGMDWNYKTRGNIGGSGFVAVSDQTSDSAKALIVSENPLNSNNGAAVLFYSTTDGTNTIVGEGYGWEYITNVNPTNMPNYSQSSADGSYALYLNLGTFPDQATGSVTWYYAAAPVSHLSEAVSQVGQSAGVTPTPTPDPTPTPTPDPTPTPTPEAPTPVVPQQQVNNVVTTIVNQATVTPPPPVIVVSRQTPPPPPAQTQTNELLQTIMPQSSNTGVSYELVGTTDGNAPVQTVSMEDLQKASGTQGGISEIRVPLANDSLVSLVNGGLNLPSGVSQEFYVVDNSKQATNK